MGASSSAAAPQPSRPSALGDARAYERWVARVKVTTPNRKGQPQIDLASRNAISVTRNSGAVI
ncbi:MAG: hypothetical protein WDO24_11630 [Pseudomonadota bacterium]